MKARPVRQCINYSCLKSAKGFSLIEVMVALGIATVLGVGSMALVDIAHKQKISAESKRELVATALSFKRSLGRLDDAGASCTSALSLSSAFVPGGQTPARLTFTEGVYQDGQPVPGVPQVRVDKLYLADNALVSQNTTSKTYVSTLFLEPSIIVGGNTIAQRSRSLATILLQLDNSDAVISCNIKVSSVDSKTNCNSIAGTVWNTVKQVCQTDVPRVGTEFAECPGGLVKDGSGTCVPAANNCVGGTVARSFDNSIVQACTPPPANYIVLARPAPAPASVVAEGAAAPSEATSAPYVQVPVGTAVSIAGTGSSAPGGGCSATTTVGETVITQCQGDPDCVLPTNPPVTPATRADCSTTNSIDYTTPPVVTIPPQDPSPPPVVNTCVCGNYRIDPALNEYCLSCRYKDSGFLGLGQKTYYYDGSSCVSGNLVPMSTVKTKTDPGGTHRNCKNKLWRGTCIGGNCRQYYNDPGF